MVKVDPASSLTGPHGPVTLHQQLSEAGLP
jgi:hypothetical protein